MSCVICNGSLLPELKPSSGRQRLVMSQIKELTFKHFCNHFEINQPVGEIRWDFSTDRLPFCPNCVLMVEKLVMPDKDSKTWEKPQGLAESWIRSKIRNIRSSCEGRDGKSWKHEDMRVEALRDLIVGPCLKLERVYSNSLADVEIKEETDEPEEIVDNDVFQELHFATIDFQESETDPASSKISPGRPAAGEISGETIKLSKKPRQKSETRVPDSVNKNASLIIDVDDESPRIDAPLTSNLELDTITSTINADADVKQSSENMNVTEKEELGLTVYKDSKMTVNIILANSDTDTEDESSSSDESTDISQDQDPLDTDFIPEDDENLVKRRERKRRRSRDGNTIISEDPLEIDYFILEDEEKPMRSRRRKAVVTKSNNGGRAKTSREQKRLSLKSREIVYLGDDKYIVGDATFSGNDEDGFKCGECSDGKIFKSKIHVSWHLARHEAKEKVSHHKNRRMFFDLGSGNYRYGNVKFSGNDQGGFKCDECADGKIYTSKKAMCKHAAKHQPIEWRPAAFSRVTILGNDNFLYGKYKFSGNDSDGFKCGECPDTDVRVKRGAIYKHMINLHFETGAPPTKEGESASTSFVCAICGKSLSSIGSFRIHMESHDDKNLQICDMCGKECRSRKLLKMHMSRVHLMDNKCACDECDKVFRYITALKVHKRQVHRQQKNFFCEFCGKGFFKSNPLKTHINSVHVKLKPFSCNHCEQTFTQKGCLKRHVNIYHMDNYGISPASLHPESKLKDLEKYRLSCKYCFARYCRHNDLTMHLKRIHDVNVKGLNWKSKPPRKILEQVTPHPDLVATRVSAKGKCSELPAEAQIQNAEEVVYSDNLEQPEKS